jgi:hypothetical protein
MPAIFAFLDSSCQLCSQEGLKGSVGVPDVRSIQVR